MAVLTYKIGLSPTQLLEKLRQESHLTQEYETPCSAMVVSVYHLSIEAAYLPPLQKELETICRVQYEKSRIC